MIALNNVLLPTFGRPTTPSFIVHLKRFSTSIVLQKQNFVNNSTQSLLFLRSKIAIFCLKYTGKCDYEHITKHFFRFIARVY